MKPYGYIVLCCGCTDCFAHAFFAEEDRAQKWALENCRNPEGFIVRSVTKQEFIEQWEDM